MKTKNNLYSEIKQILEQSRNNAVRAVNFSMVIAYWEIGKRIVEEEQEGSKKASYGEYLLLELAEKLTKDFGKGFSLTNLKYVRQFYQYFSGHSISHSLSDQMQLKKGTSKKGSSTNNIQKNYNTTTVRPELSWTHYRHLLRVENPEARTYYMNECAEQNWSKLSLAVNSTLKYKGLFATTFRSWVN